MAISAYLETARVLRLPQAQAFALLTLDRVLAEGWDAALGLQHVIAYPPDAAGDGEGKRSRIAGLLDDYAFLIHACLDGWLTTGEIKYHRAAEALAARMIADFYDSGDGGFFDAPAQDETALGALAARRKPLQDSPTPAGNPTAAAALLRLEALNGNHNFRAKAEKTLELFAGVVEHLGLYAGSYGLALERLLLPPLQVVVVGDDEQAERLDLAAATPYIVNKSVLRLTRAQISGDLPPLLKETLPHLPQLQASASFAVVCRGNACLPPVDRVDALLEILKER